MVNHDFTTTGWGHNLVSHGPCEFSTWSTPTVNPGDAVTYITADHRTVTYRVLKEGYRWSMNVHDMATFKAEKVEIP